MKETFYGLSDLSFTISHPGLGLSGLRSAHGLMSMMNSVKYKINYKAYTSTVLVALLKQEYKIRSIRI